MTFRTPLKIASGQWIHQLTTEACSSSSLAGSLYLCEEQGHKRTPCARTASWKSLIEPTDSILGDFRSLKPPQLSGVGAAVALEPDGEYMALFLVPETVPLDLTLYVVCCMQCHAHVPINLDH